MTSRLRMKPPITVWSSALTAGLAVGLAASVWSLPTEAADSFVTAAVYAPEVGSEGSAVRTVSHSTGKSGHRLTWRRHQPSQSNAHPSGLHSLAGETEGHAVQFASPVLGSPTEGGVTDPFDDPFGDANSLSGPSQPRTLVSDEVLQGATPRLLVTGSIPEIPVAEPELAPGASELPDENSIPKMLLDDALVVAPQLSEESCTSAQLESISEITHDISAEGDMFPVECPLVEGALPQRQIQGWAPITFTWKASGLCHKPAYFEDVHLEVYGHSWGPYLQPVISGAHFFLTVPVLPYKMGLYPPHECIYSLGYYRPGSCAPYMLDPLPLSIRAGLAQAGVMTGMVYLIP